VTRITGVTAGVNQLTVDKPQKEDEWKKPQRYLGLSVF
jgi:hypothetical protein